MTEDHIIWWAQEAGCSNLGIDVGVPGYMKMFTRFAEQVAAKEREACAAIVDAEMDEWDDYDVNVALNNAAAEIRARYHIPDTTKMIDTGIDRGAWSDVPDATKWVDELRGDDEEPPNSTTDFVELPPGNYEVNPAPPKGVVAYVLLEEWLDNELWPEDAFSSTPFEGMTPLYTAPPKREWQGLTWDEVDSWELPDLPTVFEFVQFIEAKLREKNT